MERTKEFKNMEECIVPWGDGWHCCKNNENHKNYGGCKHWVYTDFHFDDGIRHPGWCNRVSTPEKMFDENDELFIL